MRYVLPRLALIVLFIAGVFGCDEMSKSMEPKRYTIIFLDGRTEQCQTIYFSHECTGTFYITDCKSHNSYKCLDEKITIIPPTVEKTR